MHAKPQVGRLLLPSLLIVLGLAGASWAYLDFKPEVPDQVETVALPDPSPASACESSPAESATSELDEIAAPDLAAALYPDWPALGDRVGTITLPTLDLSWPIYEGTTESQLSQGVGHFVDSVLPGMTDNSVLSGHRSTVFNRLGELKEGDFILISTSAGEFTYQVSGFQVVSRTSREVIVPTPTAVLTLTTCHPFNYLGRTTDAFIVSADLVDSSTRDW